MASARHFFSAFLWLKDDREKGSRCGCGTTSLQRLRPGAFLSTKSRALMKLNVDMQWWHNLRSYTVTHIQLYRYRCIYGIYHTFSIFDIIFTYYFEYNSWYILQHHYILYAYILHIIIVWHTHISYTCIYIYIHIYIYTTYYTHTHVLVVKLYDCNRLTIWQLDRLLCGQMELSRRRWQVPCVHGDVPCAMQLWNLDHKTWCQYGCVSINSREPMVSQCNICQHKKT